MEKYYQVDYFLGLYDVIDLLIQKLPKIIFIYILDNPRFNPHQLNLSFHHQQIEAYRISD